MKTILLILFGSSAIISIFLAILKQDVKQVPAICGWSAALLQTIMYMPN